MSKLAIVGSRRSNNYVGIVGHEEKKFNADSKEVAVTLIRTLLSEEIP